MILIALGSNLAGPRFSSPVDVCTAAIAAIARENIAVTARSRWFRTAPVPVSDQPWYINGVIAVETDLDPALLLDNLHAIEASFGRVRVNRNEARVLDLDLLAYGDRVLDGPQPPILPHPRLHERAFVLLPLADIAPAWRHPRLGLSVPEMIWRLPPDQIAQPL